MNGLARRLTEDVPQCYVDRRYRPHLGASCQIGACHVPDIGPVRLDVEWIFANQIGSKVSMYQRLNGFHTKRCFTKSSDPVIGVNLHPCKRRVLSVQNRIN